MDAKKCLYTLLAHNVYGDKQLKPRWIGFRAELELGPILSKRKKVGEILKGGIFLPTQENQGPLDNPVYFTIIRKSEDIENYLKLYSAIYKIGIKKAYLVTYSDQEPFNSWNKKDVMEAGAPLPVPDFELYEFTEENGFVKNTLGIEALKDNFRKVARKGRKAQILFTDFEWANLFDHIPNADIQDLYVERLVFDGFLGFGVEKGIPADIDAVIAQGDGRLFLVEVKEKDLSKRPPIGFGMDIRRRDDLAELQRRTGMRVFYIVREVHEQKRREFKSWKIISLDKYIYETVGAATVEGGTGMRNQYSSNPTTVCSVENFKEL